MVSIKLVTGDEIPNTLGDTDMKELTKSLSLKSLEDSNRMKLYLKENLLALTEKNKCTTKSLIEKKREFDNLKSALQRELFFINATKDKQSILLKKRLNEYRQKKLNFQRCYKNSTSVSELEELIKMNENLMEECNKLSTLFELTQVQYNKLIVKSQKIFRDKISEFCEAVEILQESNTI